MSNVRPEAIDLIKRVDADSIRTPVWRTYDGKALTEEERELLGSTTPDEWRIAVAQEGAEAQVAVEMAEEVRVLSDRLNALWQQWAPDTTVQEFMENTAIPDEVRAEFFDLCMRTFDLSALHSTGPMTTDALLDEYFAGLSVPVDGNPERLVVVDPATRPIPSLREVARVLWTWGHFDTNEEVMAELERRAPKAWVDAWFEAWKEEQ
jgi:hypothetical protein